MFASSYIAAGDSIIFLLATVVEQPQATFAANDTHCQEHSCSAAFFCCSTKSTLLWIQNSLNSKYYHYNTDKLQ